MPCLGLLPVWFLASRWVSGFVVVVTDFPTSGSGATAIGAPVAIVVGGSAGTSIEDSVLALADAAATPRDPEFVFIKRAAAITSVVTTPKAPTMIHFFLVLAGRAVCPQDTSVCTGSG